MAEAAKDQNFIPTLLGASSSDGKTPVRVYADPTTHRLLVDASGALSSSLQTDVFTATNAQTSFTASQTVVYTVGFYLDGLLQTPTTDYTVAASVATLAGAMVGGVPSGTKVVWVYTLT